MKTISEDVFQGKEHYKLEPGDILFNNTNSKELVGKTCLIIQDRRGAGISGGFSNHITRIRVKEDTCNSRFLALSLHSAWRRGAFLARANRWVGQAGINLSSLSAFRIPLPPMEVQQEIVAEIEGYQKVIDGARTVVENYRPHIAIDPEWPLVALGEACQIKRGRFSHRPRNEPRFYGGKYPFIQTGDVARAKGGTIPYTQTLNDEGLGISRLFPTAGSGSYNSREHWVHRSP